VAPCHASLGFFFNPMIFFLYIFPGRMMTEEGIYWHLAGNGGMGEWGNGGMEEWGNGGMG